MHRNLSTRLNRPSPNQNTPPKRRQTFWQNYEWFIILTVWFIALALGYIGFFKHAQAMGSSLSPLDIIYRMLQLIPMESGAVTGPISWQLQIARFLVPAIAAYAAAKAVTVVFQERIQLIRLRFIKDHVIICGLGQKGFLLADQFSRDGKRVVIIEQDEDNTLQPLVKERGVLLLNGDATDPAMLQKASVLRARHLISVCSTDGANSEVAVHAQEITKNRSNGVLTCTLHISDSELRDLLKEQELSLERYPTFRLQLFDIYAQGARLILNEYPLKIHSGRASHLLIVGLGNLGENLVIQAAKNWQEQQEQHSSSPKPLRMTLIDRQANEKVESLSLRYPQLTQICELRAYQTDIYSPEFQRGDFLFNDKNQCEFDTIYICLDDDSIGLHTGLTLLKQIRQLNIPLVIRMIESTGLAVLLQGNHAEKSAFKNLFAFGLLNKTCTPEFVLGGTHEILAQALHEEYIAQQLLQGQTVATNPILISWPDLPEHLKESNRRVVDDIRKKFAAIGVSITSSSRWEINTFEFRPSEVELMARMEHDRWMEERQNDGWTYALGVKNPQKKTHPDLVAWEILPESVQIWNRNTIRELPTFLAKTGFEIYRLDQNPDQY